MHLAIKYPLSQSKTYRSKTLTSSIHSMYSKPDLEVQLWRTFRSSFLFVSIQYYQHSEVWRSSMLQLFSFFDSLPTQFISLRASVAIVPTFRIQRVSALSCFLQMSYAILNHAIMQSAGNASYEHCQSVLPHIIEPSRMSIIVQIQCQAGHNHSFMSFHLLPSVA